MGSGCSQRGWNPKKIALMNKYLFDQDLKIVMDNMGYYVVPLNRQIAKVIRFLGRVYWDYEVGNTRGYVYVSTEDLTAQEREVGLIIVRLTKEGLAH